MGKKRRENFAVLPLALLVLERSPMPIDSFVTILSLMASGSDIRKRRLLSLCPRTEGRTDGRHRAVENK